MTEIRRELNISTEAHFVRMHPHCWLPVPCIRHVALYSAGHGNMPAAPLYNRPCWRR